MAIEHREALVAALLDGAYETPLWRTFLDRLAAATGADNASLSFRPQDRPADESVLLASGDFSPGLLLEANLALVDADGPLPHHLPPEGQPYSLDELFETSPIAGPALRDALARAHGITVVRQMRVREASGVDAWLSIVRGKGRFAPAADRLLVAIAPVLRGVVRNFIALERERFAATMASDAMRRLRFGWFTLDHDGRVLQSDATAESLLADTGCLSTDGSGRIAARRAEATQDIYRCLAQFGERPNGRARAIAISREPWTDMLLLPARARAVGDPKATALCYVHRDELATSDRCDQLADLFGLAPREARLALALSRGLSIGETAEHMGITIGSARMYSKSVYAKIGARGLPDLVRIISRSVLALSA